VNNADERKGFMEKVKRPRVSYSLEEEYQELFKEITKKTRRNLTDELRMMLDARAMSLGLTPVAEVDPKSSGLIPGTA
jgi:preprotein translocase subunit SecD